MEGWRGGKDGRRGGWRGGMLESMYTAWATHCTVLHIEACHRFWLSYVLISEGEPDEVWRSQATEYDLTLALSANG